MSNASQGSRMPAYSNSMMHDETRAMIRARIETLLTSGAVASQVSRRLVTKGCQSPWSDTPDPSRMVGTRPAERSSEGRCGWRSNNSRRESL
ncbi:hypothetical protein GCM10008966_32000 [Rhodovulum strictum]